MEVPPLEKKTTTVDDPVEGTIHWDKSGQLIKTFIAYSGLAAPLIDSANDFYDNQVKRQVELYRVELAAGTVRFQFDKWEYPKYTDKGVEKKLYPIVARLKNWTYGATLKVRAIYTPRDPNLPQQHVENIEAAFIPIMRGSSLDYVVREQWFTEEDLRQIGEDITDPGGYFIVNGGREVTIVMKEMLRKNRMFLMKTRKGFPSCMMTCATDYGTEVIRVSMDAQGAMGIHMDGFGNDSKNQPVQVGIFRFFRLIYHHILKQEASANLDNYIALITSFTDPKHVRKVEAALYPSLIDYGTKGNEFNEISRAIGTPERDGYERQLANIFKLLDEQYFPQMTSATFTKDIVKRLKLKTQLYAKMVCMLAEHVAGVRELTDRDEWQVKQLMTPGLRMLQLFRVSWRNTVIAKLQKLVNPPPPAQQGVPNPNVDFETILKAMPLPSDGVRKDFIDSFTGARWGTKNISLNTNTVQTLKRGAPAETFSHLRQIDVDTSRTENQKSIRAVQMSQWRYVCPAESPEGKNLGILKHLALTAISSVERSDSSILDIVASRVSENRTEVSNTCLIVNGKFVGWVEGRSLREELVARRRQVAIPFDTCIVLTKDNTLNVYTDAGRLCAPVLIVNKEKDDLEINVQGLWDEPFSILRSRGCVEYLDVWEAATQSGILVAESLASFHKTKQEYRQNRDKLIQLRLRLENTTDEEERKGLEAQIPAWEMGVADLAKRSAFTHCELDPQAINGVTVNLLPSIQTQQGPRVVFAGAMGKAAAALYHGAHLLRFDGTVKSLAFPTRPMFEVQLSKLLGLDKRPAGQTAIVAFSTAWGWNQEDGIVVRKGALDLGKFRLITYMEKKVILKSTTVYTDYLELPKGSSKDPRYHGIGPNGLPRKHASLHEGDCVIAIVRKFKEKGREPENKSVYMTIGEDGRIDRISISTSETNKSVVRVKLREFRPPTVGDKFAPRNAQKGTFALVVADVDMPVGEISGIMPDIMINPHSIPSRMTMEYFIEILTSKGAALKGERVDATPFRPIDLDNYRKILRDRGYNSRGYEPMISGISGKRMEGEFFMGPCYWQALKHHVKNKVQFRGESVVKLLTRQPPGGRVLGAVRFGEWERDAALSHGVAAFLKERLKDVSDSYPMLTCAKCGTFSTRLDPKKELEDICMRCGQKDSLGVVVIPYVFSVLENSLAAAGIDLKLKVMTVEEYRKFRTIKPARQAKMVEEGLETATGEEEPEEEEEEEGRETTERKGERKIEDELEEQAEVDQSEMFDDLGEEEE